MLLCIQRLLVFGLHNQEFISWVFMGTVSHRQRLPERGLVLQILVLFFSPSAAKLKMYTFSKMNTSVGFSSTAEI